MNLKDSYLHGTDSLALIRALKWENGVLKYLEASESQPWKEITGFTSGNYLPLSGGTVTGATTFNLAINADILGNATSANRLSNPANIAISGAVTGNSNFDGSGNITIATTVNHSHSYVNTIGTSGNTLTWSINGIALTAITIPYATVSNKNLTISISAENFAKAQYSGFYNVGQGNATYPIPGTNYGSSTGNVAIHAAWDNGSNTAGLDILINDSVYSNLYFRARVGNNGMGTWKTIIDNTNYDSFITSLNLATINVSGQANFSSGITGNVNGNASTATLLLNPRTITIGSQSYIFNGGSDLNFTLSNIGATVSNTWTAGTTAGPTISTTVNGVTGTAVAIPAASSSASGIVTTGAQTFAGNKAIVGTFTVNPANTAIVNIGFISTTTDTGHIYVSSGNGAATNTRPLVLQNGYGNVGIGVAAPTYKLEVFGTTGLIGKLTVSEAINRAGADIYGTTTIVGNDYNTGLKVKNDDTSNVAVGIEFVSNTTAIGNIGIGSSGSTSVQKNRPFVRLGSIFYQLVHSTVKTAVGGTSTPVYVDANGQIQAGTAITNHKWANLSIETAAKYNTEPEFGKVKIGNGTDTTTAGTYCQQVYDATNKCLKFIFV